MSDKKRIHASSHLSCCASLLSPESLEEALRIRANQIKRFMVRPCGNGSEISVHINKVSSRDIKRFRQRLDELDGVEPMKVGEKKRGNRA